MGVRQCALATADAVGAELQRAAGSDLRVELAQAAGRGVARIGERSCRRFASCRALSASKPALGMKISPRTSSTVGQPAPCSLSGMLRTVRTLALMSSPVLPSPRVAPRTSWPSSYSRLTARPSSLGSQLYSTSAPPPNRSPAGRSRPSRTRRSKSEQVLLLEGVAETEHRHVVAHLAERRQRRAADPLGRRFGSHQLGMLGFQRLEFAGTAGRIRRPARSARRARNSGSCARRARCAGRRCVRRRLGPRSLQHLGQKGNCAAPCPALQCDQTTRFEPGAERAADDRPPGLGLGLRGRRSAWQECGNGARGASASGSSAGARTP